MNWLERKLGAAGVLVVAALLVVILIVGAYYGVRRYFTKDLTTQVRVGQNQTSAAIESGHQAVNAIGDRQTSEVRGAQTVKESQDEINRASDPGSVTDAGLNGLHRVRGTPSSSPRK